MRIRETLPFLSVERGNVQLLFFLLCQLCSLFPQILPFSCFLSGYFVSHHLSSFGELYAFCSSGLSLSRLFRPILLFSLLLSLGSFFLISEWSTTARLRNEERERMFLRENLLSLIHNTELLQSQGIWVEVEQFEGNCLKNVRASFSPLKAEDAHYFLWAKEIEQGEREWIVTDGHLFSSRQSSHFFPHWVVEHFGQWIVPLTFLNPFLSAPSIQNEEKFFPLRTLLDRFSLCSSEEKKKISSEIWRRLIFGLAPLCFTWLGLVSGVVRERGKRSSFFLFSLLTLFSFWILSFVAKRFHSSLFLAFPLYTFSPLSALLLVYLRSRQILRGDL